jgi:MFS family permease
MIGWQAIVASGGFLCATLIGGLIVMNDSSFVLAPWQLVFLYWAAILFAILVNTVISHLLPKVEGSILILHTFGFFAILIPLVYFAPHGSASDVFTLFINGGWQTDGLSLMVGIVGPVFSLLGECTCYPILRHGNAKLFHRGRRRRSCKPCTRSAIIRLVPLVLTTIDV